MAKQRKNRRRIRSRRPDDYVERLLRDAAFAAIRLLYCEALPLWRTCARGHCRRNQRCLGDRACLPRHWRQLSEDAQQKVQIEVARGGRRRTPPATQAERNLRRFQPSNFVH